MPVVSDSLKFLAWETKDEKFLFRLERSDGAIKAVPCEGRKKHVNGYWDDAKVLEY